MLYFLFFTPMKRIHIKNKSVSPHNISTRFDLPHKSIASTDSFHQNTGHSSHSHLIPLDETNPQVGKHHGNLHRMEASNSSLS